jgi:hypothetical protein
MSAREIVPAMLAADDRYTYEPTRFRVFLISRGCFVEVEELMDEWLHDEEVYTFISPHGANVDLKV